MELRKTSGVLDAEKIRLNRLRNKTRLRHAGVLERLHDSTDSGSVVG